MKLYNTLTRKVEDFIPIDPTDVRLFVCGPTVYDYSHIGHAKTYVQMDILARVLRANGYKLTYLQNITDIDDKIINRAQETNQNWKDVSTKFEKIYIDEMTHLNNMSVDRFARATNYIEQIISQVKRLIDKGYAYEIADDGIYFEISTYKEYGKLSRRTSVKEDDAVSRIDMSGNKRGWNDFCLWKFSKPGEPIWEAPFGNGRPGWHIEDTAISEHFFGEQYDIHGGATDLIFPHHEAEITQMESISGKKPFVKYWVHSGFLTIDGERMGKSKGNFTTLKEIFDKGYDPLSVRFLMLQSHYRSSINFSWELLDAAANRLNSLRNFAVLRYQPFSETNSQPEKIDAALSKIKEKLSDNINTPEALSELSQLENTLSEGLSHSSIKKFNDFINEIDSLLGLKLSGQSDITDDQKKLIRDREEARRLKDYKKADELRNELLSQKIEIKDSDNGPIWYRS